MEILKPGIHYVAVGTNGFSSEIIFCHKDQNGKFVDGITNEELVKILHNRLIFLSEKQASKINFDCLEKIRELNVLFNIRHQEKLKNRKNNVSSRNDLSVQTPNGKD